MAIEAQYGIQGLSDRQVLESRAAFGRNEATIHRSGFLEVVKDIFKDPMTLCCW